MKTPFKTISLIIFFSFILNYTTKAQIEKFIFKPTTSGLTKKFNTKHRVFVKSKEGKKFKGKFTIINERTIQINETKITNDEISKMQYSSLRSIKNTLLITTGVFLTATTYIFYRLHTDNI